MKRKRKQQNARRPLWMYLVYVILICGIFGATTYSRYTSQITGTGTATVARFAVNSNVNENMTVAVPTEVGKSETTPITISNIDADGKVSEVELEYTMQITSVGDVPFEYTLEDTTDTSTEGTKGKGTRVTLKEGVGDASNVVIDSETGTMPVGEKTVHTYNLTVTWPSSANDSSLAGSTNAAILKVDISQSNPGMTG